MEVMFKKVHVTGVSSAIPGQHVEDHGIGAVGDEESSTDKDVVKSPKKGKRHASSSGPSNAKKCNDKSCMVREFAKMVTLLSSATSERSTNMSPVATPPTIKDSLSDVV